MTTNYTKFFGTTCFVCLFIFSAYSQSIKISGKVFEKSSLQVIQGVSVIIKLNGNIVAANSTNDKGFFELLAPKPETYEISFTFIGLKTKKLTIAANTDKYIGAVFLEKDEKALKEVKIEAAQIRVEQKGDTMSINASAFKVNPDATTEDLVKKMPGITNEGGTLKAQGEDVKKILLDGKEFFGDDVQMALKNLPAEIVDKVQIFNRLSDQAQFTGFNDGNTDKTMNITTKNGRNNGTFGKFYAGYGTNDRYQSGGNFNLFSGNRRITILALSNNINQQNFAMQDLFGGGATAPRMPMGGGGRGGRGEGGGDMSNFMVGQQTGISQTNSVGLNYADKWGTKTQISGSYFFNNSKTNTDKNVARQYLINPESNRQYDEKSLSTTNNFNNRFNLRIEHTFDSFNALIFTPKISFQNNEVVSSTFGYNFMKTNKINGTETYKENKNSGLSFGSNLLYRHKFLKQGRTISLNLGFDFNQKINETFQNSVNSVFDTLGNASVTEFKQRGNTHTYGSTYSTNLTYTEPLSKTSQLQFSYSPATSLNLSTKETHRFDSLVSDYTKIDSTLSNTFDNTIITQKGNIGYNFNNDKHSFSAGLTPQLVSINSLQSFPQNMPFNKSFFNVLPNLVYSYKFTNSKTLRLVYRTNTNTPPVTQMQNVVDNSNPFLLSSGNPDLKQELSHIAVIRYGVNHAHNSQSFFIFGMINFTDNSISNATYIANKDSILQNGVLLPIGSQLSKPINLNGNISARSFVTYGIPVKKLKSNLNLNAGVNYTSVPGLINYKTNYAKTFNIIGGFVLGSNISQNIDFTISHNANLNYVQNTLQNQTSSNYFINTSGIKGNVIMFKSLVLSSDLNYTHYRGLGSSFNQNFFLCNAAIAYKFLKMKSGEIRFSVFDILNQNNNISRTVTETYIEDNKSNVLNQYFMLTFTYNLRKFNAMQTAPSGMR